jgi:NADPH:quinone reductase-like Zn-dependent oxidoreductase
VNTTIEQHRTTKANQMRAVVQDQYGLLALRVAMQPKPEAGPGEVVVRVKAAGVDRGVWHIVNGKPYIMRAVGFGLRRPKIRVPGQDLAGVVEAVGSGVKRFQVGDEVMGTAINAGAYAEYAKLAEDRLTHKPANLSFEQAAALPVSAITALKGMRVGKVQAGQKVLVIGAGGGVGGYAVQIAKSLGAEVTGVASTSKLGLVIEFGADHVIDYTREDIADGGPRFDVILDFAGNRKLSQLRKALKPRGTLVIGGGEGGGNWFGGIDRQLRAVALSLFTRQKLTSYIATENLQDVEQVAELAQRGDIKPRVDRLFGLHETREALEYLEQGHARGKVVVAI